MGAAPEGRPGQTPARAPEPATDASQLPARGELPEITEVKRLSLQPGDIVIITCPGSLTAADADLIRDRFRQTAGDVPLMVLPNGMDLYVADTSALVPDLAHRHGGRGAGWYRPAGQGWQHISDAEAEAERYPDMAHFMHEPRTQPMTDMTRDPQLVDLVTQEYRASPDRADARWVMGRSWYDRLRAVAVTDEQERARAREHASLWISTAAPPPDQCPVCGAGPFADIGAFTGHVAAMADPASREPNTSDHLFGLPIEVREDGGEPHLVSPPGELDPIVISRDDLVQELPPRMRGPNAPWPPRDGISPACQWGKHGECPDYEAGASPQCQCPAHDGTRPEGGSGTPCWGEIRNVEVRP